MRHIERLEKPNILQKKEQEWLEKFLKSNKDRPDSSKYAHEEIVARLANMSHQKCFYCERLLDSAEVDHYIEVEEDKELAFAWENLYLACDKCNRKKISNANLPVAQILNPCEDSDAEIAQHLTFLRGEITAYSGSDKGLKTITKYDLKRGELNLMRKDLLLKFAEALDIIRENQLAESRQDMTSTEKATLQYFKQADQPFSLMFRLLLAKHGL